MPLNSEERFNALMAAIGQAEESLKHGEEIYKDLKKTVWRQRIVMWVATIGLVLDLTLSVVMGVALINQSHLSERLNTNTAQVHDSECSVNTLFLGLDTPDNFDKAPDKAKYVVQFKVLYNQRTQLDCQPPIKEPDRTGW